MTKYSLMVRLLEGVELVFELEQEEEDTPPASPPASPRAGVASVTPQKPPPPRAVLSPSARAPRPPSPIAAGTGDLELWQPAARPAEGEGAGAEAPQRSSLGLGLLKGLAGGALGAVLAVGSSSLVRTLLGKAAWPPVSVVAASVGSLVVGMVFEGKRRRVQRSRSKRGRGGGGGSEDFDSSSADDEGGEWKPKQPRGTGMRKGRGEEDEEEGEEADEGEWDEEEAEETAMDRHKTLYRLLVKGHKDGKTSEEYLKQAFTFTPRDRQPRPTECLDPVTDQPLDLETLSEAARKRCVAALAAEQRAWDSEYAVEAEAEEEWDQVLADAGGDMEKALLDKRVKLFVYTIQSFTRRAFYPSWLMAEICRRLRQEAGVLALHGMHETGISREEGKSTGNPHHQGCGIAMSGFNPDRAKEIIKRLIKDAGFGHGKYGLLDGKAKGGGAKSGDIVHVMDDGVTPTQKSLERRLEAWTDELRYSSKIKQFLPFTRIEAYGPPSLLELMADLAASSCPAGAAAPKTGPGCPCAPSAEVNARAAEQMAAAQALLDNGATKCPMSSSTSFPKVEAGNPDLAFWLSGIPFMNKVAGAGGSTQLWYGGAKGSTDEQLQSNGPLRGVAADASQADATAAAVKLYGEDAVAKKVAKSIAANNSNDAQGLSAATAALKAKLGQDPAKDEAQKLYDEDRDGWNQKGAQKRGAVRSDGGKYDHRAIALLLMPIFKTGRGRGPGKKIQWVELEKDKVLWAKVAKLLPKGWTLYQLQHSSDVVGWVLHEMRALDGGAAVEPRGRASARAARRKGVPGQQQQGEGVEGEEGSEEDDEVGC